MGERQTVNLLDYIYGWFDSSTANFYPDGVMVAQEILVLLAGVRLPFGVLLGLQS